MNNVRVVWLLKIASFYWHPLMSEFTRLFPQTTVFTGKFSHFAQGYENTFSLEVVGKIAVLELDAASPVYGSSITYLSPSIIRDLIRVKPQVIFTDGFCLWTVFVLLLKVWFKWRVIVIYDGSSPSVNHLNSPKRLFVRRMMNRLIDAFITNNRSGKDYLVKVIGAEENTVFAQPYLVPDTKLLLLKGEDEQLQQLQTQSPIFICVGQIIPRKGIKELLEACSILQTQGYHNYTVLILGEGHQREELEIFTNSHGLETNVKWVGPVDYSHLGTYFQYADVFVFPTHEDIWGMVVPEAMALGKPVLTSKWAGAAELVVEGENGYYFEPREPAKLAELMKCFINNPNLITSMGQKSQQLMAEYTPASAAESLKNVTHFVLEAQSKSLFS